MAEKDSLLIVHCLDWRKGGEPPSLSNSGASGAAYIHSRPKLRLLSAYDVSFIRGSGDDSPWREEGRQSQLKREPSFFRQCPQRGIDQEKQEGSTTLQLKRCWRNL